MTLAEKAWQKARLLGWVQACREAGHGLALEWSDADATVSVCCATCERATVVWRRETVASTGPSWQESFAGSQRARLR
jgi:hypothetical protein